VFVVRFGVHYWFILVFFWIACGIAYGLESCCCTPLHEKCTKHHGHKGDPRVSLMTSNLHKFCNCYPIEIISRCSEG
jgi:hypothetical protein